MEFTSKSDQQQSTFVKIFTAINFADNKTRLQFHKTQFSQKKISLSQEIPLLII